MEKHLLQDQLKLVLVNPAELCINTKQPILYTAVIQYLHSLH